MAFRIANKNPIDLSTSVGVGVSLNFAQPAVFQTTYTTAEQLKYNLQNYFLTSKGERYFNPNFGSTIKRTVFESIESNTLDNLKLTLQKDISTYFPTITLVEVEVYGTPDLNQVQVQLTYQINRFNVQDTLLITL